MLLGFSQAMATHIVGGEIYYDYLGNNNYRVTMIIYRDCFNGVPPFDNPASVGVYDQNNNLVRQLAVTVNPDSVLIPPTINNPCFIPPTNICYRKASYTFFSIFLPHQVHTTSFISVAAGIIPLTTF